MYGQELRYTKLSNWKGRLVFTIFGETYPGHLIRFFINRRYFWKYADKRYLKILEIGSNNGAFAFCLSRNPDYMVVGLEYNKTLAMDCQQICAKINRSNLFFICADASYSFPLKVSTTRIAGGLISPKRALLLAPLKGISNNFSKINTRYIISDQILFFIIHLYRTTSTFFEVEKYFVFKLCKYFHLCILFLFFEQFLIPFICYLCHQQIQPNKIEYGYSHRFFFLFVLI